MSALEDDIARIARMRGKSPDSYIRPNGGAPRRQIAPQNFQFLYGGAGTFRQACEHVEVYDSLPPKSRAYLRESTHHIHALNYEHLLGMVAGDEDELIRQIEQHRPLIYRQMVVQRYGHSHPQAESGANFEIRATVGYRTRARRTR